MRQPPRILFLGAVLTTLVAGLTLSACGTQATLNPLAGIDKAIAQVEAVCDLPPGTVTRSSDAAPISPQDVMMSWSGGHAEVDPSTGRVRFLLVDSSSERPATPPSDTDLDRLALRDIQLLGWDARALEGEGFTAASTGTVDQGDAPAEYTKTWAGHDKNGVSNTGLIEVALDARTGGLLHFSYFLGPRAALKTSTMLTQDQAVAIALQTIGDDPPADPSTTATLPGGAATTGPSLGIVMKSAELRHTNAVGITGGKDMLVWVIDLGGYTRSGYAHPKIYIDAVTGKVLQEMY